MQRVTDLLIRCYEYDVAVFSEPWMYVPFLIPAWAYLVFFLIKWTALTAPLWLPIRLIARGLRRDGSTCEDIK